MDQILMTIMIRALAFFLFALIVIVFFMISCIAVAQVHKHGKKKRGYSIPAEKMQEEKLGEIDSSKKLFFIDSRLIWEHIMNDKYDADLAESLEEYAAKYNLYLVDHLLEEYSIVDTLDYIVKYKLPIKRIVDSIPFDCTVDTAKIRCDGKETAVLRYELIGEE